MEPEMKYVSPVLRALLALTFLSAGGAKLAGVDAFAQGFDAIGFGQWFMYFTGMVEVTGAVLLWWPNKQVIGAALLGATMVGATLANVLVMGDSPLPAIILGLMNAAILYLHRAQIPTILAGSRST